MAKFSSLDSGGGEAQAILGEDLGAGFTLLLRPVQVSGCFQDIAQLGEKNLALGVLGALLGIEAYCLYFAFQHHKPVLATLVLALMIAEIYTFRRSMAEPPKVEAIPLLVGARCTVCQQDFFHEQGHRKGQAIPRRQDEPAADVCSRVCEQTRSELQRAA